MRILIATDSFPPNCGGSGWSTYELAKGLRALGHGVTIVQPRPGHPHGSRDYDGFAVDEFGCYAPGVPFVRNYFKNERLYRRLAAHLGAIVRRDGIDVVHGQHLLTAPPSVAAAREAGVAAVCTIRDYWPVCYWSDLIHDPSAATLCPGCSARMMTRCLRPHAGALWPLTLPAIPYMRSNLAAKQATLAAADAVIAVSSAIAADLRARVPGLGSTRLETIPNPVDLEAIRAAGSEGPAPLEAPYVVYVGKLAPNKGVTKLIAAIERADLRWPLVVVGDGPERPAVERQARARGRDVRFTGWVPRPEALRWLAHASVLVFPSHGPESLSRVLLEAGALGVPVAAMDTGGTRDIVIPGVTGLLSDSADALGSDLARLVADRALATSLADAARAHVERTFASALVVARVDALYREVSGAPAAGRGVAHD
jgi:glycosyltransferase involved in cell wall biosynthesis